MSTQQHGPQIDPSTTNETATQQTNPTPEVMKPQRGPDGRFARGNDGGPGNPFARQTAEMRKMVLACLTQEKLEALVNAMIDKGIKGDVAAAKLILQHAIGKPTEAPNPDFMDLDELSYFRREAGMMQFASTVRWEPDPCIVLTLMRAARHAGTDKITRFAKTQIEEMTAKARGQEGECGVRSAECGFESREAAPSTNGGTGGQAASGTQVPPSANGGNGEKNTPPGVKPPMANGGNGERRHRVNRFGEVRLPNRVDVGYHTSPSTNGKHPAVKK